MKPFVILYATREGQTRRIAEHIQSALRDRGQTAFVRNAREARERLSLERYGGAIVAASVHVGKHEPEIIELIKSRRDELEELDAAFLSVSLAEASAEDSSRSPEARAGAAAQVQQVIDRLLAETGWRPRRVKAVAGALLYSKYNFIVRFFMKRMAKKSSLSTETSRDYEFTDWKALDAFVDQVLSDQLVRATPEDALAPA